MLSYNPLLPFGFDESGDTRIFIKDDEDNDIDITEYVLSLKTQIDGKVNIFQGSGQSNKVLITDPQGNVTTISGVVMNQSEREKLAALTNPIILKGIVDTYEELYTIENPQVGWCFLVPFEEQGDNQYKEYVYTASNRFEMLGNFNTNLIQLYYSGVAIDVDNNNNINVKYNPDTLQIDEQGRLTSKNLVSYVRKCQTLNDINSVANGEIFHWQGNDNQNIVVQNGNNTTYIQYGFFYKKTANGIELINREPLVNPIFNEAIELFNGTVNVRYKGGNWNIGRDSQTNQLTINGKFVKQVEDLNAYTDAPVGEIIEYIGEKTDENYTNGYFYKKIGGTSYTSSVSFNISIDIITSEFSISKGTYYAIQKLDNIVVNAFAYKKINDVDVSWITYYDATNPNDTIDHVGDKVVWADGKITTIASLSGGYASIDDEGNDLLNANRTYINDISVYLCVNKSGDFAIIAANYASILQGVVVDDKFIAWNSLIFNMETYSKITSSESVTITTSNWQRINVQPTPNVNEGVLLIQRNGVNVESFSANDNTNKIANIIVPTKTSDLSNDSGFITKAVNDLSYYYTKDVIDTMIAPNLRFAVVQSLPTENISGTTIYLVPKSQSENQNVYDEYVYIATVATPHWEKIGDTTVDLSNYYTKTQTDANFAAKSHTHTASDVSGLATVATSGSYNDLSNKPTIPTVNNATLTIQKNGTNVQTFTANASSNKTANITVPTKVSELTNDSGYTTNTGTVTQVKVGSTAYNPSNGVVSLPAYPTNTDTGATSVETTGGGNAVTSASYSASNRKITLTKGITTLVAGTEGEIAITDNSDLNDYTTFGTFGTAGGHGGSTTAASLINKPTFAGGFRMYVESCGGDGSYIKQTIITKAGLLFVRTGNLNTSTWTSWEQIRGLSYGSSTTTFLRNDGIWATPADTNTHRPIQMNGTEILGNNITALNLKAGSNVSLSNSNGNVTINATDTNTTYTIAAGDNNGQIKVTPSSGSAYNVNVKGLGSAAYTDTEDYWRLGRGIQTIPASSTNIVNLNDYVDSGNYTCTKTADAEYVTNHPDPTNHAGFNLVVLKSLNSNSYIRQIVFLYNENSLYMRTSTDSGATWSSWRNLASNTTYSAGNGLNLSNSTFSVKYGSSANTACQGNDSRLSDTRTPKAHNQASNTINAMTGYSMPSSTSAITTSDTLNSAIGKLEKSINIINNTTWTTTMNPGSNLTDLDYSCNGYGKVCCGFFEVKPTSNITATSGNRPTLVTINNVKTLQNIQFKIFDREGTDLATCRFEPTTGSTIKTEIKLIAGDLASGHNYFGHFSFIADTINI